MFTKCSDIALGVVLTGGDAYCVCLHWNLENSCEIIMHNRQAFETTLGNVQMKIQKLNGLNQASTTLYNLFILVFIVTAMFTSLKKKKIFIHPSWSAHVGGPCLSDFYNSINISWNIFSE